MTAGFSSGGGILDPDGAFEQIEQWRGRVDRLAADTRAMSERLQDLRVTASDADGAVRVTVDSTGKLLDLWLGQRIQHLTPDALAATIMRTIGEARGRIAGHAQEIIADTVGTESPAARALAERVGQQLRTPDPATGEGGDPARRWRV